MRIYVTEKDIKEGRRGRALECPIARAVNRRTKKDYFVAVTSRICRVEHKEHFRLGRNFTMTEKARNFVKAFDARKKVKPFTFNLPLEELR